MPVQNDGTHWGGCAAIMGVYTDQKGDIRHLALSSEDVPVTLGMGAAAKVIHMGPPLVEGSVRPHLLGWLEGLEGEVLKKMRVWALNQTRQEPEIQYVAMPAWVEMHEVDTISGSPLFSHFSCAGFVHCCYQLNARIELVCGMELLPAVDLEILKGVWTEIKRFRKPELLLAKLAKMGLHGNGPWPVLLPAYLFHAIRAHDASGRAALPYTPKPGDWQFSI